MVQANGPRLVRSVLLGLAVLLLVGGGTGLALAAGPGMDGPLEVPAPGPGDKAVYEGRSVTLDADARPLDVTVRMELEWLPAVQAVGRDFVLREAHPLRSSVTWAVGLPQEDTYVRTVYYDAGTGEGLLRVGNGTVTGDDGWHYGLVLDDAVGAPPEETTYLNEVFTGRMGECGMRVPFQGTSFDGKPFSTMGVCLWAGPATYEPRGWQGRGGGRAFVFEAREDERFHLAYDSTSPFPARFHSALNVDLLPDAWAFGRHFAFERVGWTPSGLAYGSPAAAHDLGGIQLAALTPWTLDDSGVLHPFPLREAYAAILAEQDPATDLPPMSGGGPTTVAEFYEEHPDAYVAVAVFGYAADRQGELHPNWWLAFTDGHDVMARRVERSPPSVADAVYLPRATGTQDKVTVWNPDPAVVPIPADGVFPPPARLPQAMPLVADALARYEDLTGLQASAYSFQVRCLDPGCTDVRGHLAAGQSRADLRTLASSAGSPVIATRTVFDHIWVSHDGHLDSRAAYVKDHQARLHLVDSHVEPQGTEPAAATAATALWQVPPTGAVASVSFLALVASLLYYFWPAVKGAGLGLFSRTRDDELLEHPRRAQVLQLVQAEPGIHFQDLARRLAVGRGTLDHHLRKMLAAGLLTKVQHNGYACYFPKGAVDRRVMAAAPLLRSGGGRAVFQALRQQPGRSGRELALALGLSQSTVSYHLRKLQEAGLVFGAGDGAGLRLSPLGEQAAAAA